MNKNAFLNRELSWIEFNARVLDEGLRGDLPLLERLKFLSIVSSNFDEFFMVRVAGLKRQVASGITGADPSGLSPKAQLKAISRRAHEVFEAQTRALREEILPGLAAAGLSILRKGQYSQAQERFLEEMFTKDVLPILTPVRVEEWRKLPEVGNLRIHVAFLLQPADGAKAAPPKGGARPAPAARERTAVVRLPTNLPRFIHIPCDGDGAAFALLEDVVETFGERLFPGNSVLERAVFKVTRDADFAVDEARDEDFLTAMEEILVERQSSEPVRLTIAADSGKRLKARLPSAFDLGKDDVYEIDGPIDLRSFMEIAGISGFDSLKDEPWRPVASPDFPPETDLWDEIKRRDLMLFVPYESFDPVVRFIEGAAQDPHVLAIKMTLYRTSGNSPIVRALEHAAQGGKQVTALVELKARFDEGRNISWAHRLERAGAIVTYGVADLKVHAKAALVIRREPEGIRRYLHLSTGNYNDKTARLYADLSLFTSDEDFCYDASLFFNAVTGYSEVQSFRRLVMAPFQLKARIISLIQREATRRTQEYPGLIMAKMNSLTDPDVIQALYAASRAGVTIRLNVRGICMLVPGVPGLSENISVVSIIDRYLEHTRIFSFSNGGAEELYLASADWMERNLEKRVELMFPVVQEDLRRRVSDLLKAYWRDNSNSHELAPDGSWKRRSPPEGEERFRVQEYFHDLALSRAEATRREPKLQIRARRSHAGAGAR